MEFFPQIIYAKIIYYALYNGHDFHNLKHVLFKYHLVAIIGTKSWPQDKAQHICLEVKFSITLSRPLEYAYIYVYNIVYMSYSTFTLHLL